MAHSPTCRDDRPRHHGWAVPRTSDDAAGAGKSRRASFLTGKDVAAIGIRIRSTRPLGPLSATAVIGELDQQPIANDGTDESGKLEDCTRRIVDNESPLTEAQRSRLATLLGLHAAADHAPQGSRCYRGHFKRRRHPAAAVESARTKEQHR